MAEVFDTKLTPEETLELTNRLMGFYENLETIQDYFLERKKEKIVNIDHDKYTKLMFDDFSIEPKNMNFVIEQIEGKLFNPATQIITSLPLEAQIGRQITLGVKETNTNKYIGFIRLASPVLSIKPRNDLFEGLKVTANEVNKYMINGAIIVPVQPFGYNYLGGKLLALICCSHEAREMLKEKYGERIDTVFMETTSLYGDIKGVSQYDGLKPFMKYGSMTESDIFMFPSDEIFMSIRNVLRPIYGKEEWGGSMVDPGPSGPKMREFNKIISIIKNHLKVQNPLMFKEFSAQNRYEKLKEENRLRHEMEIYTLERIESGNVDMVR
jgi:hypothetical protein